MHHLVKDQYWPLLAGRGAGGVQLSGVAGRGSVRVVVAPPWNLTSAVT
jgi:hypothetical protein